MAEATPTKTPSKSAAKPRKTAAKKTAATTTTATDNKAEAKSRFNAALEEAKAGAAALKAEAGARAGEYRTRAKGKGDEWKVDAKNYGDQAKGKASELAVEGKTRASGALASLSGMVNDTAPTIDEKLGAKYGDYARSASRSLQDASTKLDEKSIDELTEDAREAVRKSPGMAVGIAAVAGFMLARMFGGRRG